MSHTPATNVKLLPGTIPLKTKISAVEQDSSLALNMILRGQEKGKITDDTHTLVEYSSGSTVISMGILAHIYGIQNTKAYLSNKTSPTKLDLLRFFVSNKYRPDIAVHNSSSRDLICSSLV
jgi:cysteine synthase A